MQGVMVWIITTYGPGYGCETIQGVVDSEEKAIEWVAVWEARGYEASYQEWVVR